METYLCLLQHLNLNSVGSGSENVEVVKFMTTTSLSVFMGRYCVDTGDFYCKYRIMQRFYFVAVLGVIICCICGADLSALLSGYLESFLHAKPGHTDVISFHAFLFTP